MAEPARKLISAWSSAVDDDMDEGVVLVRDISRPTKADSFGFGLGRPENGTAHVVSKVNADGPAAGILQVGDEILAIDNIITDHVSHATVVRVICRRTDIKVRLRRPKHPRQQIKFSDRTSSIGRAVGNRSKRQRGLPSTPLKPKSGAGVVDAPLPGSASMNTSLVDSSAGEDVITPVRSKRIRNEINRSNIPKTINGDTPQSGRKSGRFLPKPPGSPSKTPARTDVNLSISPSTKRFSDFDAVKPSGVLPHPDKPRGPEDRNKPTRTFYRDIHESPEKFLTLGNGYKEQSVGSTGDKLGSVKRSSSVANSPVSAQNDSPSRKGSLVKQQSIGNRSVKRQTSMSIDDSSDSVSRNVSVKRQSSKLKDLFFKDGEDALDRGNRSVKRQQSMSTNECNKLPADPSTRFDKIQHGVGQLLSDELAESDQMSVGSSESDSIQGVVEVRDITVPALIPTAGIPTESQFRRQPGEKLGFTLIGGSDNNMRAVFVCKVLAGGCADKIGIQTGDRIVAIGETSTMTMTYHEVLSMLKSAPLDLSCVVVRNEDSKAQFKEICQQVERLKSGNETPSEGVRPLTLGLLAEPHVPLRTEGPIMEITAPVPVIRNINLHLVGGIGSKLGGVFVKDAVSEFERGDRVLSIDDKSMIMASKTRVINELHEASNSNERKIIIQRLGSNQWKRLMPLRTVSSTTIDFLSPLDDETSTDQQRIPSYDSSMLAPMGLRAIRLRKKGERFGFSIMGPLNTSEGPAEISGVYVFSTNEETRNAGLYTGDWIQSIDGVDVSRKSCMEVYAMLRTMTQHSSITLQVLSDSKNFQSLCSEARTHHRKGVRTTAIRQVTQYGLGVELLADQNSPSMLFVTGLTPGNSSSSEIVVGDRILSIGDNDTRYVKLQEANQMVSAAVALRDEVVFTVCSMPSIWHAYVKEGWKAAREAEDAYLMDGETIEVMIPKAIIVDQNIAGGVDTSKERLYFVDIISDSQLNRVGVNNGDCILAANDVSTILFTKEQLLELVNESRSEILKVVVLRLGEDGYKQALEEAGDGGLLSLPLGVPITRRQRSIDILASGDSRPATEGYLRTVIVTRTGDEPFGIGITGGADTSLGGVFVTRLSPDGAASRCPPNEGLEIGDRLIEVNGQSLLGALQQDSGAIFRQSHELTLVVMRLGQQQFEDLMHSENGRRTQSVHTSVSKLPPIEEERYKRASRPFIKPNTDMLSTSGNLLECVIFSSEHGLGMHLEGGVDSSYGGIFVARCDPHSRAQLAGVFEGDRIIEVNNECVLDATLGFVESKIADTATVKCLLMRCGVDQWNQIQKEVESSTSSTQGVDGIRPMSLEVSTEGAPVTEGSVYVTSLDRTSEGKLGFSVVGGSDHDLGGVFISRSDVQGRLQSGDRLLAVDNMGFITATTEHALNVLKTCPSPVKIVALQPRQTTTFTKRLSRALTSANSSNSNLVQAAEMNRNYSSSHISTNNVHEAQAQEDEEEDDGITLNQPDLVKNNEIGHPKRIVLLDRGPKDELGFGFSGNKGERSPFFVSGVLQDDSGLLIGDHILSVNGIDVSTTEHDTLKSLLTNATSPVSIGVRSDPDGFARSRRRSRAQIGTDAPIPSGWYQEKTQTSVTSSSPRSSKLSTVVESSSDSDTDSEEVPEVNVRDALMRASMKRTRTTETADAESVQPPVEIVDRFQRPAQGGSSSLRLPQLERATINKRFQSVRVRPDRSSDVTEQTVRSVVVPRRNKRFGMAIWGSAEPGPIFVGFVVPKSPAADKHLCAGDQILSMNGRDTTNISKDDALAILPRLAEDGDGALTLKLKYNLEGWKALKGTNQRSTRADTWMFQRSTLKKEVPTALGILNMGDIGMVTNVTIHKVEGKFMVGVVGGINSHPPGVYINKISPLANGNMQQGDRILEVEGVSMLDKTHEDAINTLKLTGNTVELIVLRFSKAVKFSEEGTPSIDYRRTGQLFPVTYCPPKETAELGFEVSGGSDTPLQGVFISNINADDPKAANFQVGDRILELNGLIMSRATEQDARSILEDEVGPEMKFTILRVNEEMRHTGFANYSHALTKEWCAKAASTSRSGSATPTKQSFLKRWTTRRKDTPKKQQEHKQPYSEKKNSGDDDSSAEYRVDLELSDNDVGFGFSILASNDHPPHLLVGNCRSGSVADRDGRLQFGDQIIEINGIDTTECTQARGVDLIKSSTKLSLVLLPSQQVPLN